MFVPLKTRFKGKYLAKFDGKSVDFAPYFRFFDYGWWRNNRRPTSGFGPKKGKRLIVAMPAAGSQPQVAIAALVEWHRLTGTPVTILTMHPMRSWNYLLRDEDDFIIYSGFGSAGEREMERNLMHLTFKKIHRVDTSFYGLGDLFEEAYPHLIITNVEAESRVIDGVEYYSMGPSADFVFEMITNPYKEANSDIPVLAVRSVNLGWMYGNLIRADRFDSFTEWEMEIHDSPPPRDDPVADQIGVHVFDVLKRVWKERNDERAKKDEAPEGLTTQIGIGRIATAIFEKIAEFERKTGNIIVKKLLTEVTGDGVENLDPEKDVVCTIALGSKSVRETMTGKPHREVRSVKHTNGPATAEEEDLVCANWLMQASLRGGGASEIGGVRHGGSGGAPDFAGNSKIDAIFGLQSRRWNKEEARWESNIVLDFEPGSTVVAVPANRILAFATEHGIAYLRPHDEDGDMWIPSQENVAKAMIAIAHPDFREELTQQAIERGLIDASRVPVLS